MINHKPKNNIRPLERKKKRGKGVSESCRKKKGKTGGNSRREFGRWARVKMQSNEKGKPMEGG